MNSAWSIREYTPDSDDEKFVYDYWLKSFRDSPWAGNIPNNQYAAVMSDGIRQLLARGAKLHLAVNTDNSDQFLGFICHEQTARGDRVLHYVCVKDILRGNGIAKALLAQAGIDPKKRFYYTYRTKLFAKAFPMGSHEPSIQRRLKA